jgi:hypothetical protein
MAFTSAVILFLQGKSMPEKGWMGENTWEKDEKKEVPVFRELPFLFYEDQTSNIRSP